MIEKVQKFILIGGLLCFGSCMTIGAIVNFILGKEAAGKLIDNPFFFGFFTYGFLSSLGIFFIQGIIGVFKLIDSIGPRQ